MSQLSDDPAAIDGGIWRTFERTAARSADRPAVLHDERSATFGQLHAAAYAYAARLLDAGVKPGDRVLVWASASPEMGTAVLAVWAVGGIVVMLDISSPAGHLRHALDTAEPVLIVAHAGARIPIGAAELNVRLVPLDPADADARLDRDAPLNLAPRGGDEPASIVFTSGSTGKPKGVTQSHRNLLGGCGAVGRYLGLTADDRILCPVPWSFDYGYGQLLSTLVIGSAIVVPATRNPASVCAAIQRHRVTVFAGIPSLFAYLVQGMSPLPRIDRSGIRIVTNTGGTIPAPVLATLLELFAHSRVFLNYGLTESYRTSYLDPSLVRDKPLSIGRGVEGVELAIVRDDGSIAPPGEVGQIVHRGKYIFLEYWRDPEATARSRRPDPLDPSRVALFTGDLGRIDADGLLYIEGRIDHQLKSMGVRVAPAEIEALLHESGLVAEVGVFGRPHELFGDVICAAVVLHDDTPDNRQRLDAYARKVCSPYMTPRVYLYTRRLPRTHTGKIDYPTLRCEAAERPAPIRPTQTSPTLQPPPPPPPVVADR